MDQQDITQDEKNKYFEFLFTKNGKEFIKQSKNYKHILHSFITNGATKFLEDCNQFKSYYNYQKSNDDTLNKEPLIWFNGKDDADILNYLNFIWNDLDTLKFKPGTCIIDDKPKEYLLAFKLWGLVWH